MQDIGGAGQALVETLLAQIEGRDLPPRRLAGRLIVRGSSAPATGATNGAAP
jgi:DNA-binding LacI/PurR family transcriptional regulator